MKRNGMLLAALIAAALTVPNLAQAQTQPPADKTQPMTGMKPDRTTATTEARKAMREREAAQRKKRAECRARARAEKIPLLKRPAFVKKCRSEGN